MADVARPPHPADLPGRVRDVEDRVRVLAGRELGRLPRYTGSDPVDEDELPDLWIRDDLAKLCFRVGATVIRLP